MAKATWAVLLGVVGCNGKEADEQERSTTTAAPLEPPAEPPDPVDDDGDGFSAGEDCDDTDNTVFPGAVEVCGDDRITDCDADAAAGHATVEGVSARDLNALLASAAPGAEILLCGTFFGTFTAPVPVHLLGHPGAAAVLDGAYGGTTLTVPGGAVIENLSLVHGSADTGGGLRVADEGEVILRSAHLADNRARLGGGVEVPPGATVTLESSTIVSTATEGGGGARVLAGGTLVLDAASSVSGDAQYGGGVLLEGGTVRGGTIDGDATGDPISIEGGVVGNTRPVGGGGVAVVASGRIENTSVSGVALSGGGVSAYLAEVLVVDSTIGGGADLYGGGVLGLASTVRLEGTSAIVGGGANLGCGAALFGGTLVGGSVSDSYGIGDGVGLYLERATADGVVVRANAGNGAAVVVGVEGVLIDVRVEDNGADGIYAFQWSAVDASAVAGRLEIVRGTISRNGQAPAMVAYGGGLFAQIPTDLSDTVFDANFSDAGAAAFLVFSEVTMTGGAITGHDATVAAWPGAVAVMGPYAVFTAVGVDFGTAGSENTGGDVYTEGGETWDFDGVVSARCTAAGCVQQ